jgi:hypothetical protein
MRSLHLLLPLLLLAGCAANEQATLTSARSGGDYDGSSLPPLAPGDDDESDPTAGDDDDDATPEDPAPALDVVSIEPPPASEDHHYRMPVVVGFNGYAAGAQLRMADEDGTTVPTLDRWSADYTVLTAWPHDLSAAGGHLRPLHTYSVRVDIGNSSLSWSFTTSAVGLPVVDPGSLQGRTYAVSFADARSPDQPALAALLSSVVGPTWLWQVDLGSGDLDFNYGLGMEDDADGLGQDLCTPTALVGGGDAAVGLDSNPYFASAPGDFVLWLDGQALEFEEGWVDGDFLPDGSGLVEVGYRGWLRVESLAPLLGDDACALLSSRADLVCGACPSGEGDCAFVDVGGVTGAETSFELAPVADADADCADGDGVQIVSCSAAGPSAGGWLLLPLIGLALRRR